MKKKMTAKAAKARLQNAGLELTDHRQTVLRAVANAENPCSAPEIFEQLKQGINRVTVYRILDLLVEKGVLNRLGLGEKSQRFCLRGAEPGEEHAHFHCTKCDKYLCLETPGISLDSQAMLTIPMDIEHVDIRLEGVCQSCKNTK